MNYDRNQDSSSVLTDSSLKAAEPKRLGLGVVGCGGFGLYALQHFLQVPGVSLLGMAQTARPQALAAAKRFGLGEPITLEELCKKPDIDMVYVATPPFLHYEHAKIALQNGKHVICEKPLTLKLEHADELLDYASRHGLLFVTNQMQRYNPLIGQVTTLIREKLLGEPLHAFFENYACDEGLAPDHWFWDRTKSGGIFIEHGVHFFDVFAEWFGKGELLAAQHVLRPESKVEETVNCTLRYPQGVLANFFHTFTQPGRMDRQTWRILFERGDITLHHWVPVQLELYGAVDEAQTRRLMEVFPGTRLDIKAAYGGADRVARARFKPVDIQQMISLREGLGDEKLVRYGELLRSLFSDQKKAIEDPNHVPKLTGQDARDALRLAVEASAMAV